MDDESKELTPGKKAQVTKKRRKKVVADSAKYLHQVQMKMPRGRRMKVSVTAEGNRFSLILMAERMKEVLNNQLSLWQLAKDRELSTEDLYRFSNTMQQVASISYRAHGDHKDAPAELPKISSSQNALLKEAIPEAWALIEQSQSKEGVFKKIDALSVIDAIDIESEERGLNDESVDRETRGS